MKKLIHARNLLFIALTAIFAAACHPDGNEGRDTQSKNVTIKIREAGISSPTPATRGRSLPPGELKSSFEEGDVIHVLYAKSSGSYTRANAPEGLYATFTYTNGAWIHSGGDELVFNPNEMQMLIAVWDGITTPYADFTTAYNIISQESEGEVKADNLQTTKDILCAQSGDDSFKSHSGQLTIESDGGLRLTFAHYRIQLNVDVTLNGYPEGTAVTNVCAVIKNRNSDIDYPFPAPAGRIYTGLLPTNYDGLYLTSFKVSIGNETITIPIPLDGGESLNIGRSYTYHLHLIPGKGWVSTSGNLEWGAETNLTAIHAGWTAIRSVEDLELIRNKPNGKFIFMNDIDLEGNEWTPIDDFSGMINGRGHTIRNLKVVGVQGNNAGFFKIISSDAMIYNLHFAGADIDATAGSQAGIMAGNFYGYVQKCTVQGTITPNGSTYSGGLFGYMNPNSVAILCSADVMIDGTSKWSIAGNVSDAILIGCYSTNSASLYEKLSSSIIAACYYGSTKVEESKTASLNPYYEEQPDGSIKKIESDRKWEGGNMWDSSTESLKLKWNYNGEPG